MPTVYTSPASPAPDKCILKYFSGAGKVYINTFQVSPAPERYKISTYIYRNTSPAP